MTSELIKNFGNKNAHTIQSRFDVPQIRSNQSGAMENEMAYFFSKLQSFRYIFKGRNLNFVVNGKSKVFDMQLFHMLNHLDGGWELKRANRSNFFQYTLC